MKPGRRPQTAAIWLLAAALCLLAALAAGCQSGYPADVGGAAPLATSGELVPLRALDRRPNVVVVMTDDETVADMQVMAKTRRLIGGEGVTFDQSHVSFSLCCPSRATYLTGRYAHNHHVLGLTPPLGGYAKFARLDGHDTLPVWLEASGYRTTHIGKYLNGYGDRLDQRPQQPPGWSEWHATVGATTYRMWGYRMFDHGRVRQYGSQFDQDPALYQTDVFGRLATDFITRHAGPGKPFFLSLAFLAPHHEAERIRLRDGHTVRPAPRHRGALARRPLEAAPGFDERDTSDKPSFLQRIYRPLTPEQKRALLVQQHDRQESLLAVDDQVERLVDTLRLTGELDNTYIVFTSDNGYLQGEHRVAYGKMLAYDPSTKVPLLIRGPGIAHGQVAHELVANIDLAPTVAEVAGAHPTRPCDGRSLLPYARNPSRLSNRPLLHETAGLRPSSGIEPNLTADAELLSEGRTAQDETGRPVYPASPYRAIRTRRWLYVRWSTGDEELYDRRRDPGQLHSLARSRAYRPVIVQLDRQLRQLVNCKGRACSAAAPPVSPPSGL
ncbi:MAG: N-acetylglucosamine-6-sulfatase [Thermoleophilaceae bacterium]|nr:N-acetylglucosamine-6-sulfatase [Thermoleophilaceae bacterium]